MGLKAGPYDSARDARSALREAGYTSAHVGGRRPDKWIHPTKRLEFAVRILNSGHAKIVRYPDLRRLDYRISSDAERSGQGFKPEETVRWKRSKR